MKESTTIITTEKMFPYIGILLWSYATQYKGNIQMIFKNRKYLS